MAFLFYNRVKNTALYEEDGIKTMERLTLRGLVGMGVLAYIMFVGAGLL